MPREDILFSFPQNRHWYIPLEMRYNEQKLSTNLLTESLGFQKETVCNLCTPTHLSFSLCGKTRANGRRPRPTG